MKRALLPAIALFLLGTPAFADEPIPADTEVVTLPSGLKYSILKPGGEGLRPKIGDSATVHYTGWLTDGTVFDSSRRPGRTPFTFVIGRGVISGWSEGVALMKPGARYKLTIPHDLAYGEQGRPKIPPKATLIFDIELLEVKAAPVMPTFRAANPAAQKKTESGLLYEPIREGEGEGPGPDDAVELKFALWNASGKLLQATEQSGENLQIKPSASPVKFLAEAVRLLKPGARYRFEVPPELAFGSKGQGPDLPPNSVTVWEFELVRVNKPLPVPAFESSPPGRVKTTSSGLRIEVLQEGTGASPKLGDEVTVHYAGWLADGTLFDSSFPRGVPTKFKLGEVIPGWNEGLQTMKEGGKAKLTIPGILGYGVRGNPPTIPPNATLVFHVELLKVGR